MSLEGKGCFFSTPWTAWEEDILISDQNNEIVDRENPPFPLFLTTNGDEEETRLSKSGEELPEEKVRSLVEAASLLGLEDNNISHHEIIYGALDRENPPFPSSINGNMDENRRLIILHQQSDPPSGIEPSNPNVKKEEHNAKERERRMKLSQTYSALCSLLPNARRSKKRWSSTTIIDKVVDYIPTLQKEIEKLNEKKQNLIKAKEITNKRVVDNENEGSEFDHTPTVSIHQVSRLGDVIVQICINQSNIIKLSTLIQKAEGKNLRIIGASTVYLSDDHPTLTCHLHLQMDRSLQEAADYKSILRKRVNKHFIFNVKINDFQS